MNTVSAIIKLILADLNLGSNGLKKIVQRKFEIAFVLKYRLLLTKKKKKGVKDQYSLEFPDSEVEITCFHEYVKELYDKTPERTSFLKLKLKISYELLRLCAEKKHRELFWIISISQKNLISLAGKTKYLTQFNKRS